MLWITGRPDGISRRPDGWQGIGFSDMQTVLNFLEALLKSGIPVQKHHYKEVILSNRMQPTLKLTLWHCTFRGHCGFLFILSFLHNVHLTYYFCLTNRTFGL
jgi:hypothetical protein